MRLERHHIPRGFSLIEMLIVIGVILLLTAITVTVISGLTERSEVRETENTMRLMEQALSEWELATGRQVTFGINNQPCNQNERYEIAQKGVSNNNLDHGHQWGSDSDAMEDALLASNRVWAVVRTSGPAAEIIARINPDHLEETEVQMLFGNPESERFTFQFRDAWDNPILAILPGRVFNDHCPGSADDDPDAIPDDDGTIRTPFENRFGIAANRRIYFVSAGPSGRFGNLHLDKALSDLSNQQREDIRRAADNIYSHDIVIEEGREQ